MNDLGAQMADKNPANTHLIAQFPYACVEIGPGMMSSYTKRIKIVPDTVAAMALAKLGSGNNLPGYYMYQGGINPDGKLSNLEEDHPNPMPVKDYDFQTALGACGQVREQFHLLLEQHLFFQDFGSALARMPVYLPDKGPAGLKDFETLRWDVRSDGTGGFLFYNNEQPYIPLPEHKGVRFQVKTGAGTLLIPREPITIPSGGYGILPFNLNCDGVTLQYATAQPLCRIDAGGGFVYYFFSALDGIAPEFVLGANESRATPAAGAEKEFHVYKPGAESAIRIKRPNGGAVTFVVLPGEQSRHLWRTTFAGRDRLIFSNATVLTDGTSLRLQSDHASDFAFSTFPPFPNGMSMMSGATPLTGTTVGIFKSFTPATVPQPPPLDVAVFKECPAGPGATFSKATARQCGAKPPCTN